MSILPYILQDILNDPWSQRSSRLNDQHFALGLANDDLLEPFILPSLLSRNYYRPWRSAISKLDQGSTVVSDKEKFEVSLDVQQFSPDEIEVKAIDDNQIIVEGKHEEKQDEHGFISRQFTRRYVLPKDYDGTKLISKLSSDGILTISAPKLAIEGSSSERTIPITQTGPVRKQVQANGRKTPEEAQEAS
ncbi:protein lethal(2)essential for life-like [Chrysoperla carnea]|uniref:protein lethal(2)essential for life-like n=1 Tax=Chrysoperla carnea TaxID=189513 RepID=UPI001D088C92|nr:protein lethal(2)essential for life-like [Chrysoperla carnea]